MGPCLGGSKMDRKSPAFKPASFDAEEFASDPIDPTDCGLQAALIPYDTFDLVCCESSDSQVEQGVNVGVTAEYAKDLAVMSERIARLVPPRSARKLGGKPETSQPEAAR